MDLETTSQEQFNEHDVADLINQIGELHETVSLLRMKIDHLEEENKRLKSQLNTDSHNSSKPPSSDGLKKKISNLRKRTGKKPGGQKGHKGSTLKYSGSPDKTIYHLGEVTCSCGLCHLESRETVHHEIDVEIKRVVTAHKYVGYHCSHCGRRYTPEIKLGHNLYYGPLVKSLAVYLKDYHFIPYHRLSQLFNDFFSFPLSVGTLANFTSQAYQRLEPFEFSLKTLLGKSAILHADETGIRAEGKTHWMHVASTPQYTHYHFDPKRGIEAIERAGVLPSYKGTLIHDRFSSYWRYGQAHGLCNAHILRELIFLEEQGHQWAKAIKALLLKAKAIKAKEKVSKGYITQTKNTYKKIIREELKKQPSIPNTHCRGKPQRTKAHNLLIALNKYNREILAFLSHTHIPFDNNQAERDIRMVKTKQKVSGCFRSQKGGKQFARIRSFIATMDKQNRNILNAFKLISSGHIIPVSIAE